MGDDAGLVARLRAGDEAAFVALVQRYHASMVRFAATFVPSRAVAEEVVQDSWVALLAGIDRFEERSSLKTWLFRIVANRGRTSGAKERRETPAGAGAEPAVPASRFATGGAWAVPPVDWTDAVDERLDARQAAAVIARHLDDLAPAQRRVVIMRDVEDLGAEDVCRILDISEANQRVLLHRGRSKLRAALEQELG